MAIFRLLAADSPQYVHETYDHDCVERDAQKRVRKSTMMSESNGSSPEPPDDVEIWSLCRQGQREGRERRFAIHSGTPHARAGQEVSDRFQAVNCILFHPR